MAWVEAAKLCQLHVSSQFAQQRIHRVMPERDACDHGSEQGSDRIVVAVASRLKLCDDFLVGQVPKNQNQALQLRHVIGFPGKKMWIDFRHMKLPASALMCRMSWP